MEEEIWKDIPGYEGYFQASTLGRIRSIDRIEKCLNRSNNGYHYRKYKGKILKLCNSSRGDYLQVNICRAGKQRFITVHSLVALAFLGPRPKGLDVRHIDGNPKNNRPDNLSYGTRSENLLDCYRYRGKFIKTSEEQAKKAKELLVTTDMNCRQIAEEVGITHKSVIHIKEGSTFKWLKI